MRDPLFGAYRRQLLVLQSAQPAPPHYIMAIAFRIYLPVLRLIVWKKKTPNADWVSYKRWKR
ncbi:hypothetical protein GQ53DRAFT_741077 [Thozetella sp. PMI_491]|nr:hypothetical protein GQ53DRAFT_741077 [Thozetella sp. PMI_491]